MPLVDNGLEILDPETCEALVATQSVGRVGISINALPAILPVNYCWADGSVAFLTAPGTKLRAALRHAVVAFEVDDFDMDARRGWSVLIVGQAEEIYDPELFSRLAQGGAPWAGGDRGRLVRIKAELISGRRIAGNDECAPFLRDVSFCTFG